jgi:hypothetical protein
MDDKLIQIKCALLQARGAISSIPRSLLWDKGLTETIDAALVNLAALRESGEDAARQWVPKEPTREMLNAAIDVHGHKLCEIGALGIRRSPQWMFEQSYKAMLAAARESA